jgi:hypothetical protein
MKVYVAITRNGGVIDDLATFSILERARVYLRERQKDMTPINHNDTDLPEEGEFEDSEGEGWYFDIWFAEMQTKEEAARELFEEVLLSEVLGDPEDPEVSEEMRSILVEMRELSKP